MTAIQQQRLIGAILVASLVAVLAWFVLTGVDSQEQVTATADDDAIVFEPAVEPVDDATIELSDGDEPQTSPDNTVTLPEQEEVRVVVSEKASDNTTADEVLSEPDNTTTQDETTSDELTVLAEELNAEITEASTPSSNQTSQTVTPDPEAASDIQENNSADSTPHWVLQLGSFSKRDNAQSLEHQLQAAGYEPVVEDAQIDGRTIYRVRLQADHDRERLEQLAVDIKDEMGINPQIMPHTP